MGRKRSLLERAKYFKAPFRKENYSSHHKRMHRAKWIEYCGLDAQAKKSFFEIGHRSGSQATIDAFTGTRSLFLRTLIDKDIIDFVIGDMMFYLEDMNGTSRACLLSSILPIIDLSEVVADAGGISRYAVIAKNTKQFQLVARYLGGGLSFHLVAQVMLDRKELLGIGNVGPISEGVVSRYVLFICAMNLQ